MSDTTPFGFGKLVPGFDFLQSLAKGATGSIPKMPSLSNWVAPTISVEELEKRVDELKAVQFWLDQNSRALTATIQALEVQKMTLATLKGMNFSMGDVANAFKLKTADSVMDSVQKISETLAGAAHSMTSAPATAPAAQAAAHSDQNKTETGKTDAPQSSANVIDPMHWWGALTQQFQQIATSTLADAAKQGAFDATKGAATELAKDAFKAATDMASQLASKGVQSVQDATRHATSLASAAVAVPAAPAKPAAKKTTAAKNTTQAKSPTPAAKKTAARKAAPVAVAKKAAPRRPAAKSAR